MSRYQGTWGSWAGFCWLGWWLACVVEFDLENWASWVGYWWVKWVFIGLSAGVDHLGSGNGLQWLGWLNWNLMIEMASYSTRGWGRWLGCYSVAGIKVGLPVMLTRQMVDFFSGIEQHLILLFADRRREILINVKQEKKKDEKELENLRELLVCRIIVIFIFQFSKILKTCVI